jgi:hypothetical protein
MQNAFKSVRCARSSLDDFKASNEKSACFAANAVGELHKPAFDTEPSRFQAERFDLVNRLDFFRKLFASSITKTSMNKAAAADVQLKEVDQLDKAV